MSKVIFDISMSLDGFMTAANQNLEEPLGEGGLQLHAWAIGDDTDARDRKVLEEGIASIRAVIAGRETYDTSLPGWGVDGPTGLARRPVFVVTHRAPAESPEGGVYTFVTDGIASALVLARATAGKKDISVMGGASIGQQYLAARSACHALLPARRVADRADVRHRLGRGQVCLYTHPTPNQPYLRKA